MPEAIATPTAVRRVSYLAVVASLLALTSLGFAGVVAFQLVSAASSKTGGGTMLLSVTSWLLASGAFALIVGGVGMRMARGAPLERQRCWYAIAFGLVAIVIGATLGVGFV